MTRTRILSAILTATFAVAGCAAPSGDASRGPGGTPGASGSESGDPSAPTPDLGELRVSTDGWATDFTKASVRLGDFMGGGPPKDGIPAIDAPRFESIADAKAWLAPTAPVISLEIGGSARAYPLAILIWHEIVNDTLGDVPIVVTFCPLCHTALVFERTLGGTVHDFGTTGNLRYSDLVMYDRQTESWWQQATGEAIVGTLTGAKLTFLPAQIISLADFEAAYPDGDVLSRDTGVTRGYGQNPYPGYDRPDDRPFLYANEIDDRLEAKERVVTLELEGTTIAVPYPALKDRGVIEIAASTGPVVIFWIPGTTSSLDKDRIDDSRDVGATGVFDPVLDGRRLTFDRARDADGSIVDAETGSTWSITGRATAGPLTGSQLEPVVHGDHFWFAWATFAPQTEIWEAP